MMYSQILEREKLMTGMEKKDLNVRNLVHFNTLIVGGGGSTGSSGFQGFGDSGFSFTRAEDIFNQFFGGKDPFASFFDDE